ncbi:hypothetical protein SLS54_005808 [Diplodia seriata]
MGDPSSIIAFAESICTTSLKLDVFFICVPDAPDEIELLRRQLEDLQKLLPLIRSHFKETACLMRSRTESLAQIGLLHVLYCCNKFLQAIQKEVQGYGTEAFSRLEFYGKKVSWKINHENIKQLNSMLDSARQNMILGLHLSGAKSDADMLWGLSQLGSGVTDQGGQQERILEMQNTFLRFISDIQGYNQSLNREWDLLRIKCSLQMESLEGSKSKPLHSCDDANLAQGEAKPDSILPVPSYASPGDGDNGCQDHEIPGAQMRSRSEATDDENIGIVLTEISLARPQPEPSEIYEDAKKRFLESCGDEERRYLGISSYLSLIRNTGQFNSIYQKPRVQSLLNKMYDLSTMFGRQDSDHMSVSYESLSPSFEEYLLLDPLDEMMVAVDSCSREAVLCNTPVVQDGILKLYTAVLECSQMAMFLVNKYSRGLKDQLEQLLQQVLERSYVLTRVVGYHHNNQVWRAQMKKRIEAQKEIVQTMQEQHRIVEMIEEQDNTVQNIQMLLSVRVPRQD